MVETLTGAKLSLIGHPQIGQDPEFPPRAPQASERPRAPETPELLRAPRAPEAKRSSASPGGASARTLDRASTVLMNKFLRDRLQTEKI